MASPHEWNSLGAVNGNPGQVRAAIAEMRRRLAGMARLAVVTERRLDLGFALADRLRRLPAARRWAAVFAAIRPLHGLCLGRPTDAPVDNLLWQYGGGALKAREFDTSDCGLLYICPALPMDGRMVAQTLQDMERVAADHGQSLYVTLNIETATSLVAVTNLMFDRSDPAQSARARACADTMHQMLRLAGLEVYRARTDMMASVVARGPDYWRVVRELKRVLDPDNIIAPGRYNLAE
jgi:4-cresol dehydrogenase (hydroxylating)